MDMDSHYPLKTIVRQVRYIGKQQVTHKCADNGVFHQPPQRANSSVGSGYVDCTCVAKAMAADVDSDIFQTLHASYVRQTQLAGRRRWKQ